MKAIIPTGGRGTRMQPLTFSTNKHFIPIANKPLIYYPIETAVKAGIKEILITYNPGWLETVKEELGTGKKWGIKITYVLQEKPLGLSNIFQVCEKELKGDSFFLHLGDNIFADGIKEHVDYFQKSKLAGMVTMLEHPENTRMGVPYFDKNGNLKEYVEKPKNPPHKFAIPGLYFFRNDVFKCFKGKNKIKPSARGEYEIGASYQWLIDNGYKVEVKEYKGKWYDPGKFEDWIETNRYLLDKNSDTIVKGNVDKKSSIGKKVIVGKKSKIINSKVEGPSILGESVVIKDAHIGPYASIGNNCSIEKSKVKNSVIMDSVEIKNLAQTVNNSLIGSGSKIVDVNGNKIMELFIGEKSDIKL